ncbi:MAG: histone deacetylase [bacterium]
MRRTGFVYDDIYLQHKTGFGHPERPERLRALIHHLRSREIVDTLTPVSANTAAIEWIAKNHPKSYIENIQNTCKSGLHYLDSDTVVCEDSYVVARRAVGGVLRACKAVAAGTVDNAFCAVRPPGHHAEPSRAMGFCLFNNVAIAARYVQSELGFERVWIIDWDVHHGNGTQAAFYEDPTVLYTSIHQSPLYPGTGLVEERGAGAGEGFTLNFPSPPGCADKDYLHLVEKQIVPAVQEFAPGFVLISAGFDAHRDDPLANMNVTETGFAEMTRLVMQCATECCNGRLVSVLEGGYNLDALALSMEEHLKTLQRG